MKRRLITFKSSYAARERGDTIVEVLIAMVIGAAMLSGAFLVSHHSTQAVRTSEEHSQALSLLQGQLEALRAAVKAGDDNVALASFCLNGGSPPAEVADTDPACNKQGAGNLYGFKITRPASNTFQLQATWDGITGGKQQVQLVYRVYPDS